MKKLISVILALVLMLGCAAAESGAMKLTAPAGAPALAVATLAAENPENYTFVAADTIGAEFAKNETDFIIAPINAGAKLFKAGKSTYRLAAVVTWGNLYIASQKADFTLESLNGAEVTLFGENTINASVVLAVLEAKGIQPAAVSYLSGAAETQAELLSNPEAIVVTADPAVTSGISYCSVMTEMALDIPDVSCPVSATQPSSEISLLASEVATVVSPFVSASTSSI